MMMSTPNGTSNGTQAPQPVQPDPQHIIGALMQENRDLYDNKLYLLSVLRQIQAEFADARELWEMERASLKTKEG